MLQKFLVTAVVYGLSLGQCLAEDPFALMQKESIGNLRIGATEKEVIQSIASCRLQRSKDQLREADGLYHQEWRDAACGIQLDMASAEQGKAKTIASITISAPSQAKTGRGIGVGSSEAELEKAYDAERNAEESQAGAQIVAGSIYGGLIFTLNKSRVETIFLGAAAE